MWEWSIHKLAFLLVKVLWFIIYMGVFWAFGLISTYQWVHTMNILLGLGYLTQEFICLQNSWSYHSVELSSIPLCKCTTFSVSILQLRDI
jgi:ABC-type multidrug transport system permease subunit